ncbi:uncharacterized protein ACB058_017086 [Synchiropus picturatus]
MRRASFLRRNLSSRCILLTQHRQPGSFSKVSFVVAVTVTKHRAANSRGSQELASTTATKAHVQSQHEGICQESVVGSGLQTLHLVAHFGHCGQAGVELDGPAHLSLNPPVHLWTGACPPENINKNTTWCEA